MNIVKKKIFNSKLNKMFIFFFIFLSIFLSFSITNVYASTLSNYEIIEEEKKYYTGNLDDDFSDDRIIIVLSKEETNKFKNYTPQDFPEINCKSVIDLTGSE